MPRNGIFDKSHAERLFTDLRRANTEQAKKERFLQYLTIVFQGDPAAQELISALSMGAERTIANIPRGPGVGRGRADTQTDTVIIEWEKDLKRTGPHAIEQLQEYLAGNWISGESYRFVLIATDGIKWRVYAPDWSDVEGPLLGLSQFTLREIRKFDLSQATLEEFPFFLDEVLFVSISKIATLYNIQNDFGDTSSTFINSITVLQKCRKSIEEKNELNTAFKQWMRFLSIAYGRFNNTPDMFLVHTYLSVFAKFIAYSVVVKEPIPDEQTMKGILSGEVFSNRLMIDGFVEDDFFHWVANDEFFKILRPMFWEINKTLGQYEFSEIREDILKGVYQELIDLDTRHALGEYYTPDWLCERVVEELGIKKDTSMLDPACGSGSFLRAGISKLREKFPNRTAPELAAQFVGMDIHPLSVQIAKTTIILALSDLIKASRAPIKLNVYLANSLLVPRGAADLFHTHFQVSVDNRDYKLSVQGVEHSLDFDALITFCDNAVKRSAELISRKQFENQIESYLPANAPNTLGSELFDVYAGMKKAKDEGRDSIWKFILMNSYKPVFLRNKFDYVVGNPPWLTYAQTTNASYQSQLLALASEYGLAPKSKANIPHLDIAAIFLAHSTSYFLKRNGALAFVLPRSFLTGDQHDKIRTAEAIGFKLMAVWDLEEVSPLFNVPSCVLFTRYSDGETHERAIPRSGVKGIAFAGRLGRSHIHLDEARKRLNEEDANWFCSRITATRGGTRTAITRSQLQADLGQNAYFSGFRQGATIVPRTFFFVEAAGAAAPEPVPTDITPIKTSEQVLPDAKKPWKSILLSGRVENRYLFRTAISNNLLPFLLINLPLVVLPLELKETKGKGVKAYMRTPDEVLAQGGQSASEWFYKASKKWDENRTEKNAEKGVGLNDWLNWQSKLTEQDFTTNFLVLYTASASSVCAAVLDRRDIDFPFVAESKTYWCNVRNQKEGDYLSAYLNSGYVDDNIKEFQTRGLFGPRDIHKLPLKLPFPRFNSRNEMHVRLAELGRECSKTVKKLAGGNGSQSLSARELGRMRTKCREVCDSYMEQIDILVEAIATNRSEAEAKRNAKRRQNRRNKGQKLLPL